MPNPNINCSNCGADGYRLKNPATGEVECVFCRSTWVVPELIRTTETQRFLDQQDNALTPASTLEDPDRPTPGAAPSKRLPGIAKAMLVVLGFLLLFVIILLISCGVAIRSIFG